MKVVVFTRTPGKCTDMFTHLNNCLEDRGIMECKVQMYHGNTPKETRNKAIENLTDTNSPVTCIVATSALSMGVNLPHINLVVHWNCPTSMLQYWQEVGRCARDQNSFGVAIMHCTTGALRTLTTTREIINETNKVVSNHKKKARNTKKENKLKVNPQTNGQCIRQIILQHFLLKGENRSSVPERQGCTDLHCDQCRCPMCTCCTICQQKCPCQNKFGDPIELLIDSTLPLFEGDSTPCHLFQPKKKKQN